MLKFCVILKPIPVFLSQQGLSKRTLRCGLQDFLAWDKFPIIYLAGGAGSLSGDPAGTNFSVLVNVILLFAIMLKFDVILKPIPVFPFCVALLIFYKNKKSNLKILKILAIFNQPKKLEHSDYK